MTLLFFVFILTALKKQIHRIIAIFARNNIQSQFFKTIIVND